MKNSIFSGSLSRLRAAPVANGSEDASSSTRELAAPGGRHFAAGPTSTPASGKMAATSRTPGLRSQAARTIQRIWRGHHSREKSRLLAWQREMEVLCRRQSQLCDLGVRPPDGLKLHPALLGEVAAEGKKRRRGPLAQPESTPPAQMKAEQCLQRLKTLHTSLWARVVKEVTHNHPQVLQARGDRQLNADQSRRTLSKVRDDLFVAALPGEAFAEAGFLSAERPRMMCHRRWFQLPVGDLVMREG